MEHIKPLFSSGLHMCEEADVVTLPRWMKNQLIYLGSCSSPQTASRKGQSDYVIMLTSWMNQ